MYVQLVTRTNRLKIRNPHLTTSANLKKEEKKKKGSLNIMINKSIQL